VDSWLVWRLTSGTVHLTDASNASRTALFDIHACDWDDDLLRTFDIPRALMPSLTASSGIATMTAPEWFGAPIPIAGIAGDQQAALIGQRCVVPGMVKNTYGTGCFMLMQTGTTPIASEHRLLTTIATRTDKVTQYALEGSVFVAGAIVQWLRDGLGIINSSAEIESLARSVADNGGVYIVPALAGLGAPHWDPHARGAVFGLTRGSTKAHIARAALDSIALQSADLIAAMQADSGIRVTEVRVDGGAAVNDLLMQCQADVLGVPVVRSAITETTALGAALLAGLGVGLWHDEAELDAQWRAQRIFEPQMPSARVSELKSGWRRALERAKRWTD
jgi:glycerol kinase